jgi:hypothetical protein
MALTRVTLTSAIKASDLTIPVSSTSTGFPPVGQIVNTPLQMVQIDDEFMFLVQVLAPGVLQVRMRGADGTFADSHDVNASVITSAVVTDFPAPTVGQSTIRPAFAPDLEAYGQSGVIVVPTQDTKAFLSGTSAQAMTLGAPSLSSNGTELVVTSQGAFAHTIVATSLFDTGIGGSPFSTATFAAQPGATVWLVAQNGLWNVANSNGVTFT